MWRKHEGRKHSIAKFADQANARNSKSWQYLRGEDISAEALPQAVQSWRTSATSARWARKPSRKVAERASKISRKPAENVDVEDWRDLMLVDFNL